VVPEVGCVWKRISNEKYKTQVAWVKGWKFNIGYRWKVRIVFKSLGKGCRLYLCPFVLLSQNTTDWVICKGQKFISHSSGAWEVQSQGASRIGTLYPSAASSGEVADQKSKKHPLTSSLHYKDLIPCMMAEHSQRLSFLILLHWGLSFNMNFGGDLISNHCRLPCNSKPS
jgi:hypothetical protein